MQPTHLHPRRIGDILDTAFTLYRSHFTRLFTISVILLGPLAVLQLALPSTAGLIQSFQNLFLITLLGGALTAASIQTYWSTSPLVSTSYRQGRKKYWRLFVASLLQGLVIVLPTAAIGAVMALLALVAHLPSLLLISLLVAALLPVVLYFATKYAVVIPVIMSEEVGASDAMSRSWQLTTGIFWHTALVTVCANLLTLLIGQLPELGLTYILSTIPTTTSASWLSTVQIAVTQVGLMLTLPFQYLVATVLYYDLRIRCEGYDLEVAAQEQRTLLAVATV